MFFWICVCIIIPQLYGTTMTKYALHMSQATYCDYVDDWTCKTCDNEIELLNIIDHNGERAILGIEKQTLFIGFRGSSNIQNWIDNVQFSLICPYDTSSICVETGFYKVYESMYTDIIYSIKTFTTEYSIQDIVFTGHSLGGAIATLFAYEMKKQQESNIYLITFGSPRVGNKEFVEDFISISQQNQSFRITHKYDIVPHVPQQFLGYLHVPHELWYNGELEDGYIDCDDSFNEDNECSDSCGPLHCTSIQDHMYYLNVSMGSDGDC